MRAGVQLTKDICKILRCQNKGLDMSGDCSDQKIYNMRTYLLQGSLSLLRKEEVEVIGYGITTVMFFLVF
jgi:hypothetical protein